MSNFSFTFPDDFDDYAWEIEVKGWFNGVVVETDEQRYSITFYDIARLSQDIEDELAVEAAFVEKNIVVVRKVTRVAIEQAIQFIASSDGFKRLKPEDGGLKAKFG